MQYPFITSPTGTKEISINNPYSNVDREQNDVDHIYYNLTIYNDKDPTGLSLVNSIARSSFAQQSATTIIENPSEWNVAVIRMDLSILNIPLFNFITNGPFWITLKYQTATFPVQLTFTPVTSSNSQLVFNVYDFLDSINAGFIAAVTAFNAAPPFGHPALVYTPHMEYDSITQTFSLLASDEYLEGLATQVEIWWNWNLYRKFNDFQIFFNSFGSINNLDVRMKVKNRYNNTASVGPPIIYKMTQERSTAICMLDLQSIVLTTSSLPVEKEYIASSFQVGQSGKLAVLTDFIPVQTVPDSILTLAANRLQYFPAFPRLISLTGNTPIKNFDIQLGYTTLDGVFHSLQLVPNQFASIKVGFIRKGLSS